MNEKLIHCSGIILRHFNLKRILGGEGRHWPATLAKEVVNILFLFAGRKKVHI